ncbi:MAG: hypothetical protein UY12_C0026G0013 [Parcubacteria group bacterium GW2011_GWA2_47_8b]|uniref:Uncharacterized protein n=2 Tax=Parcubacteria group TaxID=1794811 RepID=A0A0G1T6C2_9BACT|nr:MAG: hypothetical protein UY02_C0002G0017 [Candidatus Giovannonibacteria bacterium GW2011_GWB1_47_6b]KKU83944.1 MAG: hypothetical protein UY12_C0026G0013 [Parcubacteria group bacterium GW2011_GWA2_47_8b]KKU94891.1 MAG: hypothetical protein UY24_C0007G0018 [Parcubacteria group bacterium GW2011_GWA1_48_11b]OGY64970.1 MAG: hypothetical protein A3E64_01155 [Candidatus Harrisonbacteria bacterium RIFCSPHIGHO2_12_FULL_48_16]
MLKALFKNSKGQSLIEILIGITIAGMLISGAVLTITASLRSSVQNKNIQTATSLGQELLDKASVFSEGSWLGVYNLDKSLTEYYLATSGPSFVTSIGMETIELDGVSFVRYFILDNVSRDSDGNIVTSGGTDDPSTQKITVFVFWSEGGDASNSTFVKYLTRGRNLVFRQTDWSGGSGQTGPITVPNSRYDTATDIDATGQPGSIKVMGF